MSELQPQAIWMQDQRAGGTRDSRAVQGSWSRPDNAAEPLRKIGVLLLKRHFEVYCEIGRNNYCMQFPIFYLSLYTCL